jgi:hypothetical protein
VEGPSVHSHVIHELDGGEHCGDEEAVHGVRVHGEREAAAQEAVEVDVRHHVARGLHPANRAMRAMYARTEMSGLVVDRKADAGARDAPGTSSAAASLRSTTRSRSAERTPTTRGASAMKAVVAFLGALCLSWQRLASADFVLES